MDPAALAAVFAQTTLPDPVPRKAAEEYLQRAALQPGFGLALLQLAAANGADEGVRLAAAVAFKNHVKFQWAPPELEGGAVQPAAIGAPEKEHIKGGIVEVMLLQPQRIQAQLGEGLALMAASDFPDRWPTLLPELLAKLGSPDISVVNGVLTVADTIFRRFRDQYKTVELVKDIKYVLSLFVDPMLVLFKATGLRLASPEGSTPEGARQLLATVLHICRIFFSLNYQELPGAWRARRRAPPRSRRRQPRLLTGPSRPLRQRCLRITWLSGCWSFKSISPTTTPRWWRLTPPKRAWWTRCAREPCAALAAAARLSSGAQVKAAICENVNLYLEKNETEFADHVEVFAKLVWELLLKVRAAGVGRPVGSLSARSQVGLEPNKDALATEGIRFLTTIVTGVHSSLFQVRPRSRRIASGAALTPPLLQDAATLRLVCENVVIPNLQFREADEELFSENYVEYIRRDMEGSDADTRRRMACELLKALTSKFQSNVTAAVSGYVGSLLSEYAAAPDRAWKQKDCAIYLVIALTVRGKTDARGVTSTNELVNIGEFFSAHIVPELRASPTTGWPVLKADALKFLTTFRSQVPKALCLELLPSVAALLGAHDNVVHSYAALAVERLLTVRDGGVVRFTAADLLPLREALLGGLFTALTLPESTENDYVMKALMRLLSVLGPEGRVFAAHCAARFAAILKELARNPRNPVFSHYLFECVATLVRHGAADAELAPHLEEQLLLPFQEILRADVAEFAPYVFQILSQLVELRPQPLPPSYLVIFPPLLSPVLWERSGNVPALVRLLQAYLARAPAEVVTSGHLNGVLGVFQKLNASRAHDHEGFYILNSLVEFLDAAAWAQHMPTVWSLLLQRLQHGRTAKYTRSFSVFLALLMARLGPEWTAAGVDGVQAGLFASLLEHVWLPSLATVSGDTERKVAAVAGTKLLCEFPPLAADAAAALWGRLLEAVVALLVEEEDEAAVAAAAAGDDEEAVGVQAGHAAYARLVNAARPETDPVPQVANAQQHLATSLARLAATQPGRLGPRIAAALAPTSQASLAKLCQEAGVVLV